MGLEEVQTSGPTVLHEGLLPLPFHHRTGAKVCNQKYVGLLSNEASWLTPTAQSTSMVCVLSPTPNSQGVLTCVVDATLIQASKHEGKFPIDNPAFDFNRYFIFTITSMKMSRGMITIIHRNNNSKK